MKDPYNLENAQKQKMSTTLQEEIDEEILREAKRTEAKNYDKAKAARQKLQQSAAKQKETTDEMRRQGEKISKSKKAAINVHENAQRAGNTAQKIEKESHMFNFSMPFVGRIKKWWNTDKKEEREMQEIKEREEVEIESAKESEYEIPSDEEEYIPGQHKTDKELHRILHTVRNVNKEAQVQSKLSKKQTTDLNDIATANKYASKRVEKTDEELRRGL